MQSNRIKQIARIILSSGEPGIIIYFFLHFPLKSQKRIFNYLFFHFEPVFLLQIKNAHWNGLGIPPHKELNQRRNGQSNLELSIC